nr:hypothetical protein Iba_chr02fCG8910 [Ipomoea batatas]
MASQIDRRCPSMEVVSSPSSSSKATPFSLFFPSGEQSNDGGDNGRQLRLSFGVMLELKKRKAKPQFAADHDSTPNQINPRSPARRERFPPPCRLNKICLNETAAKKFTTKTAARRPQPVLLVKVIDRLVMKTCPSIDRISLLFIHPAPNRTSAIQIEDSRRKLLRQGLPSGSLVRDPLLSPIAAGFSRSIALRSSIQFPEESDQGTMDAKPDRRSGSLLCASLSLVRLFDYLTLKFGKG